MTTEPINENPTDSNLVRHAIAELDRIGETSYEEPSMRKAVLDIVRTFADQGHSGSSAAYCVAVVEKLLRFQPLSPITNDPAEWVQHDDDLWQNTRDGECFSQDGGKTYRRNSDRDTIHTSAEAVR